MRGLSTLLFLATLITAAKAVDNRIACTPLAQGYELLDDSPSINAAIAQCGNGGTILLGGDQIYSIRSPIDFTPCQNCSMQIEGTLLIARDQTAYWNQQGAVIKIAGVNGARISSPSGSGVIDGNAKDYYNSGWRVGQEGAHLVHITNSSSNIVVDNLFLKDAPQRFFRLDGNSTALSFSRLNFSVEGQYQRPPTVESESFAFEMADVERVSIVDVDVEFHSRGNIQWISDQNPNGDRTVGVCVAFDRGTHNVSVSNIRCTNTWRGVVVMVGTVDNRPLPTGSGVSNILVSNLTFTGDLDNTNGTVTTVGPSYQGDYAAGSTSAWSTELMTNVTWNGVTVVSGGAVTWERCYLRCHCITSHGPFCNSNDWKEAFDQIRFRNFRGILGTVPEPGWGCASNQTECDISFQGWTPTLS